MAVYPRWRLRLDPPHEACLRVGFARASLMGNVSPSLKLSTGTWQDPLTGLVLLRPSFFDDRFAESFKPLSQWTHQTDFWRESKRAIDALAAGGSTVSPTVISLVRPVDGGGVGTLVDIATSVTIAAISLAGLYVEDALVAALESTFTHPEDAGFVIHARLHTDPVRRYKNWFGVQWGNYFLHVSLQGKVGLYHYTSGLASSPSLVEEWQLFEPGSVAARDHYFMVLPIPGYGFCVYHSLSATRLALGLSSANAEATQGHLFKTETLTAVGGYSYINPASKVVIYLNKSPRVSHDIAFAPITFPAEGEFAGELFDIGVRMDDNPDTLSLGVLPSRASVISATTPTLVDDDLSSWTIGNPAIPGSGRQGRVKVALTRVDEWHSPFIYSTFVAWDPIRQLRDPGIVEMDDVPLLSFTQEDTGRWEGKAVVRAWSSAMKRIIERGDAYFIVERQDAAEGDWTTEFGGIARVEAGAEAHIVNGRFEYQATLSLTDMSARLKESSCLWQTAFDGLTLRSAIDTVLLSVGETTLASVPSRFDTLTIPATQESRNWQNGPNVGEDGNEIVRKFLALARRQRTEARLVHTWGSVLTGTGGSWKVEDKPRDTAEEATWTLTDKITEEDIEARLVGIVRKDEEPSRLFAFSPTPPAANVLQVYGVKGTESGKSEKLPGLPIENWFSLRTDTSREYLGRTVTSYPLVSGISEPAVLDRIARAVFDLACQWKLGLTVELTRWVEALTPACYISGIRYEEAGAMQTLTFSDEDSYRSPSSGLWVRRRRVTQTDCARAARIELDLSTQWESGIDE